MKNLTGYIYCQRNQFKWSDIKSYLPVAIQYFAGINYNHVGIIIAESNGPVVYESIKNGVVKTDFVMKISDRIYGKDYIILEPTYPRFSKNVCIEECKLLLNTKYDFKNLLWHQLLWNKFNIWKGAKTEKEALKRMICYELVWFVHRRCSIIGDQWWKCKPSTIYNSGEFKKLEQFDI